VPQVTLLLRFALGDNVLRLDLQLTCLGGEEREKRRRREGEEREKKGRGRVPC
jgi:hypothetical protein